MNVHEAIVEHQTFIQADEGLFGDDGDLLVSPLVAEASEKDCDAAFLAMLATPCLSLDDVRAKVDYLINGTVGERDTLLFALTDGDGMHAEDGPFMAFLRSLMPLEAA